MKKKTTEWEEEKKKSNDLKCKCIYILTFRLVRHGRIQVHVGHQWAVIEKA